MRNEHLERVGEGEIGAEEAVRVEVLDPTVVEAELVEMLHDTVVFVGCQRATKGRIERVVEEWRGENLRVGKVLRHERDVEVEREIVGEPVKATERVGDLSREDKVTDDDATKSDTLVVGGKA